MKEKIHLDEIYVTFWTKEKINLDEAENSY
jgi:hypothetical protein